MSKPQVILFVFLLFFTTSISVYSIYLNYASPNYSFKEVENLDLEFHNLTDKEIVYAKALVSKLNEDYLIHTNKILFTYDDEELCPVMSVGCRKGCEDLGGCGGTAWANGKVVVHMDASKAGIRYVLCHEILHYFIISQTANDVGHELIELNARKGVCYE